MTPTPSRRSFLAASMAGLAAPPLFAAAPPPASGKDLADQPFRPETLFLTWHRDPTTTMVVQWVGTRGETGSTSVYYRSAAVSAGWSKQATKFKPYAKTDLKVFRAELTGLTPGTDYEFRTGKESPVFRFRTMPAKLTDSMSFVSGGDCGVNPHAVANNVQAARQDPAFALIGGDLGYDNGKSVATSLAFLRNYSRTMIAPGGRLIPMVTCIGNHEVDGGYGKTRDKAPFYYALFDGLFTDTGFASLDFGDYLSLVLLDSGHTSEIGGAQADWLEKTLRDRKDLPHVFAANHVPAYPSFRTAEVPREKDKKAKDPAGTGNRKHWVPLFDKYRVPVVLEHHDHTFKRSKRLLGGHENADGVVYLGDGSWGRIRPPKAPEKISYLETVKESYHLSLHRLEGAQRFHAALDTTGRVMDLTVTGQRKAGLVRASG